MTNSQQTLPKKGEIVDLVVQSLAFGARGLARLDDMVFFVEGGIPGQKVRARIVSKKRSYYETRVQEVLEESPYWAEPRCRHYKSCGGCSLQHLQYEMQCSEKQSQVIDALQRLGGFKEPPMVPILSAPASYYYRNKMEFSFSRERWLTRDEIDSDESFDRSGLYAGMHAKGFFDKVVDLKECHLIDPVAVSILDAVRELARNSGLPVYSTRDHQGFWRFLIVRRGINTGHLMVNVVAREYNKAIAGELKQLLLDRFPEITTLIYSTTSSKASVAFSEKEYVLHGTGTIVEKLGDYEFEISGNSFFQTNTKQAERLYDTVVEMAEFRGDENVYDLYCGAGSISIYISRLVKKVTGFESVESAVIDAYKNCSHNSINNCDFILGDLKDRITDTQSIVGTHGAPDVMVIDPPRGGMHPNTVRAVLDMAPTKIVHVSCNPATLARDLALLCENDYDLVAVKPVDMFPHTAHIEVVAKLVKRNTQ